MSNYDDLKTWTIALVGFLGTVLTVVTVLALVAIYYQVDQQFDRVNNIEEPWLEVAGMKADQQARLIDVRWDDTSGQLVAIPIDRAMRLVVEELAQTDAQRPSHEGKEKNDAD